MATRSIQTSQPKITITRSAFKNFLAVVFALLVVGYGYNGAFELVAPSALAQAWPSETLGPATVQAMRAECGSPLLISRHSNSDYIVVCQGLWPFTSRAWRVRTLQGWPSN